MRIAILSPTLPPDRGGIADHTLMMARALTRLAEVRIVTRRSWEGAASVSLPDRVSVDPCAQGWGLGQMPALRRALLADRPDLVILPYSPLLYSSVGIDRLGPALVAALRCARVPTIVLFHEHYFPFGLNPLVNLKSVVQRLNRFLLVLAAHASMVSTHVMYFPLRRWFFWKRDRIHLAFIPSNVERLPISPDWRGELRRQIGAGAETTVLALFGLFRLSRELELLRAGLGLLRQRGLDFALLALGGHGDEIRRMAADAGIDPARVSAPGFLPEPEISAWLQAADVLLLPYEDGVSPRRTTLAAGLAHGLPILTSRGKNTDPECFGRGFLRLYAAGDPEDFAEQTLQLCRSLDERQELSRQARKVYDAEFSWESYVRKIGAIANQLGVG